MQLTCAVRCRRCTQEVDAHIAAVAKFQEASDPMQAGRYTLKDDALQLYDSLFYHLTRSQHEEAREYVESKRKKSRDLDSPRPPVRDMQPARSLARCAAIVCRARPCRDARP